MDSETELLCKILDQECILTNKDYADIDWDYFLTTLDSHRLSNTVYSNGKVLPYLPPKIKEKLQGKYKTSQLKMLGYMAELHTIILLFKQNSVASATLKGPALGMAYYASPTQRESKDLDILIKSTDFQKAFEVLLQEGYLPFDTSWYSPRQQEVYMKNFHHCGLYHPTKSVLVELHWKLYSSKRVNAYKMAEVWRKLSYQKIGGLALPTLSAQDTFIYLCIHGGGYAHQWKRLFWLQDIANIIQKEEEQFVEDCYEYSLSLGAGRYVLEASLLAHLIFRAKLTDTMHAAIKKDQKIIKLARIAFDTICNAVNSDHSALPSWPSLRAGMLTFQRIYFLEGSVAPLGMLKRIFINPEGWQIFSFSDRFFALNYLIAPFLRVYTVFAKSKTS